MYQNSKILCQHINKLNSNNSLNDFYTIVDFALYKGKSIDPNLFNPLLNSKHPFYLGKSSEDISTCKGHLFSMFEKVGTDKKAVPFLVEALEISSSPFLVAAAAKGIRGLSQSIPQLARILIEGFYSIQSADQKINLGDSSIEDNNTTAVKEILLTLKWFGKDVVYLLPELRIIKKEFSSHLNEENISLLQNTIQFLENVNEPTIDYSKLSLEECYNSNNYATINKTMVKKSNNSKKKSLLSAFSLNNYFSFFNKSLKLDLRS